MRVKFKTSPSPEATMAWGYPIEGNRSNGVFGDVPEEMLEHEISAGRIELIQVKPVKEQIKEISESSVPKQPEADPKLSAATKTTTPNPEGKRGRKSKEQKAAEAALAATPVSEPTPVVTAEVPTGQDDAPLAELLNSFGDSGEGDGGMTAAEALALLGDEDE